MPQSRSTLILCALLASPVAWVRVASAATWSVEASVSTERTTEVTEAGNDRTETFDQSYSIGYEKQLNPVLRLSLDFALDVTDEINEGPLPDTDFDTRKISPSIDFGLEARWWDLTANWGDNQDSSDDPDSPTTSDTTWGVEFTAQPQSDAAPDLKIKFQRDRATEGKVTQSVDQTLEASLDYKFWDLLDITLDAKKDLSDDRIEADQDTEDRSLKFDVSFDREFGEKLTFEVSWSNERQQSLTLLDDGGVKERDDTLSNGVQSKLGYKPLDGLDLGLGRQVDWDRDLEEGTLEVTDAWTGEAAYSLALTEQMELALAYNDDRTETRGTTSDSYAIARDYSAALDYAPLENVKMSGSFDRSDGREWFKDPAEPADRSVDDAWDLSLDTAFWQDQVALSLTRSLNRTTEKGARTADGSDWNLDLTLGYEGLPNLSLTPQYTRSKDVDRLKSTTDEEKTFEVGIQYELSLGDRVSFGLSHSFSRTHRLPAEGESTLQRGDDTDLSVSWTDFLSGMTLELGLTRSASDESKDDKAPTVDYTYNVTYDWSIFEIYAFGFQYQYDKKSDAEDTRSFQTSLSVELLKGLITLELDHELDQQLQGEKKDTHRYMIEIKGKL
ncbi:MAG: hypothetical protein ACYDA8_07905 [Deferrisomatales bacterium]